MTGIPRVAVAALAAAWILACASGVACAAAAPEKVFDLTIAKGTVPAAQRTMRVRKDDMVRWRITSDAPGALHLHAYRLDAKLVAGTPAELSFKAFATGRFRVEWHAESARDSASGTHHAPPLASFEVHPR